ncbi:MAG: helix-turn-helix domain-containing protein [Lachnospiraceae bacterium]|nr:helix-turn-helix domain-containing protein [Lachnospiraceae bacterium]
MSMQFAKILKQYRTEKGLSQRELADKLFVTRSTVARWENGSRLPDIDMIQRLSKCMGEDFNLLFNAASETSESVNVILLDDTKITLTGGLSVLEEALPNATIIGFTRPSEAIEYAKAHRVSLIFLDIELGKISGLELCKTFLEINPRTNIVFVTAYSNYSLDAWETGGCGFILKPLTTDNVKKQLKRLRYPFNLGGNNL